MKFGENREIVEQKAEEMRRYEPKNGEGDAWEK